MIQCITRVWIAALLFSACVVAVVAAPTPPASISSISLKATSFTLTWTASTGGSGVIVGYDIFQNGTQIGSTTSARTFPVVGLSPTTNYSMTVAARDGAGQVSLPSAPLSVVTKADTTVPTKPSGVVASNVTTTSCTLTWIGSTDDVAVVGYNVYRSGVLLGSTTGAVTFTITGLSADAANSLTVRALDAAGNLSAASVALSVRTLANPPSIPSGLTISNLKAISFTLGWAASTGGTGGIAGYDIYQNGLVIASTTSTRNLALAGLTPNTTYNMAVAARDSAGNISAISTVLPVTTPVDTTPPSKPSNLLATNVTTSSCTLAWTGSSDDVSVTGYNVYRNSVLMGSTTSALTFNLTGLAPDTSNNLTVRATDAAGNVSAASVALAVRTLALPPSMPTGLAVANLRPANFKLTWTASTGGKGGIAGYAVYLNGTLVGSPATRSLSLTGLAPATTYSVTVTSHDSAGNVSEPCSPFAVTTPADTTPPTAPKGLNAAAVTSNSFSLAWTASTDNVGVIGYDVYRNNVLIGNTPNTTFNVTGLIPSNASSMRVKARDAVGNISGYSAVFSVTTSAKPNDPPVVTLITPADSSSFTLPAAVTFIATATDSDGSISKVEFFDGPTKLGETSTADAGQPSMFSFVLSTGLTAGAHSITARATDNQNATGDSPSVAITFKNPNQFPTLTLNADATSLTAPGFVTLNAEASDIDGTINKVEFYEGDNLLGEVVAPSIAPNTYSFPLTLYSTGTYTLTAIATDNSLAQTRSAKVVITVNSGAVALPFVANFEPTEGYRIGALNGQLSWVSTGGVTVAPSTTTGSQRELSIPAAQPVEIYSHDFSAAGVSPVFVDFLARPIAGPAPENAVMFSTPAAQVALVGTSSPAQLWIFDGSLGWRTTNSTVAIDASGRSLEWIRLTTREDYVSKKWDLYLNGWMVAADLGFADPAATALTDFSVNGHSSVVSAFDSFYAGPENPLFADVNHNGIDDVWETSHGLSLASDNRQLSPTNNGISVLQAYLQGTDPNDFFNGTTPTLTIISGNNQSAVVGQFNSEPFVVSVKNAAGTAPLANAPVTFTVKTEGGQLAGTNASTALSKTISLTTDDLGVAQVFFQQPTISGATSTIQVSVGVAQTTFSTTSISGSIVVDADDDGDGQTNAQELAAGTNPKDFFNGETPVLKVISGEKQPTGTGYLPVPVVIKVTHPDGKAWSGAPVMFAVKYGEGSWALNKGGAVASTLQIKTDSEGLATAVYWLPEDAALYPHAEIVSANCGAGVTSFYATNLTQTYDGFGDGEVKSVVKSLRAVEHREGFQSPLGGYFSHVRLHINHNVFTPDNITNYILDATGTYDAINYTYTYNDLGSAAQYNSSHQQEYLCIRQSDSTAEYDHTLYDSGFSQSGFRVVYDYRAFYSEVIPYADFYKRYTADIAAAGSFAEINWGQSLTVKDGGKNSTFSNESDIGSLYLYNNDGGGTDRNSELNWERAQVKFVVNPSVANDSGSTPEYKFRWYEVLEAPPDWKDHVILREATIPAGATESPVYDIRHENGDVYCRPITFTTLLLNPHQLIPTGESAAKSAPTQYADSTPAWEYLSPTVPARDAQYYYKMLRGAETLQQIYLALWWTLEGSITCTVLPESTAKVRLWSWDFDKRWTLLNFDSNLSGSLPGDPSSLFVEALTPGKAVLRFTASYQGTTWTQDVVILAGMPKTELAVDANRDGQIKLASEETSDATSADAPYRFWINDDDDQGPAAGNDIPGQASGTADYSNNVVDSVRDLVDFFPVYLDIKQLLTVLPPGASIKYKLKQADGALNFVYTNKTKTQAFDYQKQILTTGFGPDFTQATGEATTQQITAAGVELNAAFLDGIKNTEWGIILIEGRARSTAPLVLSVEKDGTTIAEIKLEIKISPVEDMFRNVNLAAKVQEYDAYGTGSYIKPPYPGLSTNTNEPANWPDSLTNGKYFVFTHGFNVDAESARGWSAEVFKRLHVLGSKARFVGVSWNGSPPSIIPGKYLDYHKAVFQAFQTGELIKNELSFTQGADVTFAAHSLGNVVASHAIQSGGFTPTRYFMINAASAIEAYSLSDAGGQFEKMVEYDWRGYDDAHYNGTRLYASKWHELFPSSDNRNALTWKKQFSNILPRAYNFYSGQEDVVANGDQITDASLLQLAVEGNIGDVLAGAYSWKLQELVKGASLTDSLAAAVLERRQGGWGFNTEWNVLEDIQPGPSHNWQSHRRLPSDTGSIASDELKTKPFFRRFLEPQLMDPDPAVASAKAGEIKVKYDVLARAIPAMSNAVAANALPSLGNGRNFDMPGDGIAKDAAGNKLTLPTPNNQWRHSDFKVIALPYVYPMYEAMISRGGLK